MLLQNLRYSVRLLGKQPAFALMAVAVLALGIGANSAMFSIVNAFLLKPLVVKDATQLTGVYNKDTRHPGSYRAFSYAEYTELKDRNTVFTDVAAHNMSMVGITEGETTRRVFADIVSSNYFATFGVPLYRGRAFTAEEERPGSAVPVAILNYSFWQRRGADQDILGKTLRVNGTSFTVIGISAQGFTGNMALLTPELYLPLGVHELVANDFDNHKMALADPRNYNLILVARLKSGLAPKAITAQLAATSAGLAQNQLASKDYALIVSPLSRLSVSTNPTSDDAVRLPSLLLLFLSGIVLLIASLNIANMMLSRIASRRKELAVRLSLGASRLNIIGQQFTEGLLLAALGGVGGLVVSYWGTAALVSSLAGIAPVDIVYTGAPDARVLAATVVFCLISAVLFTILPAWNVARRNLAIDLKAGEQDITEGGSIRRMWSRRNLLVIGQLALSMMLLSTAGLFIRSAVSAAQVDTGFRLDNNLIVEVDPSLVGYDQQRTKTALEAVLGRVRGIPGVASASLSAVTPFGMISLDRGIQRASDSATNARTFSCWFDIVGTDYFKTMGIRMLRGREFRENETMPGTRGPVAIISKSTAERLWPKGDALGKQIRLMPSGPVDKEVPKIAEIVGVAADVREHIVGSANLDAIYVPFGQEFQSDMNFTVKADSSLAEGIRREIRAVDPRLPVLTMHSMREHLDTSFDFWIVRSAARMFTLFGVVALVMACVGLYAVRAYIVTRRTREIGIRMALGASSNEALRMVLAEGLRTTAVGTLIGLALSLALGKLVAGMLYEVSGADPIAFITAPLLLAAVSIAACYFPARRAANVSPMVALRQE